MLSVWLPEAANRPEAAGRGKLTPSIRNVLNQLIWLGSQGKETPGMDHRRLAIIVILGLALALLIPMAISAAPSAQPAIPHALTAPYTACTTCHQVGGAGAGAPGGTGLQATHQGRADATCMACHQVAPVAAQTPTAAPAAPTATRPAATATAAPAAAAATPTAAAAAATPTRAATPAAAATATPTALPKTGGLPLLPFVVGGGLLVLAGLGFRRFAR